MVDYDGGIAQTESTPKTISRQESAQTSSSKRKARTTTQTQATPKTTSRQQFAQTSSSKRHSKKNYTSPKPVEYSYEVINQVDIKTHGYHAKVVTIGSVIIVGQRLTQDAINIEIYYYWKSDYLKRKRINENDIEFGTDRLKKKIRLLEQNRDQV
ncbi:hypothetical protein BpHYR1_023904 [Brachionus plicatilis]|uniref:Uncharacterized protein n=1 Tax=Brachionus plicatilis TaxID=10195 RepID=A0A3M7R627_BRAPC|nr:hypothetical protein BpHYR1_023904 [Brachionus plicatilis]